MITSQSNSFALRPAWTRLRSGPQNQSSEVSAALQKTAPILESFQPSETLQFRSSKVSIDEAPSTKAHDFSPLPNEAAPSQVSWHSQLTSNGVSSANAGGTLFMESGLGNPWPRQGGF